MTILFELVFFIVVILLAVRFVHNELAVRLLRQQNSELEAKNVELMDLLTTDDSIVSIGRPPKDKHILHG